MDRQYRLWGWGFILTQIVVFCLALWLPPERHIIPTYAEAQMGIALLSGVGVGVCGVAAPHRLRNAKFVHLLLASGTMLAAEILLLVMKFR